MKRGNISFTVVSGDLKELKNTPPFRFCICLVETAQREADELQNQICFNHDTNGESTSPRFMSMAHILKYVDPENHEDTFRSAVYQSMEKLFSVTHIASLCLSLITKTDIELNIALKDVMGGIQSAYAAIAEKIPEDSTALTGYTVYLHVKQEWVAPLQYRLNEWVNISE